MQLAVDQHMILGGGRYRQRLAALPVLLVATVAWCAPLSAQGGLGPGSGEWMREDPSVYGLSSDALRRATARLVVRACISACSQSDSEPALIFLASA